MEHRLITEIPKKRRENAIWVTIKAPDEILDLIVKKARQYRWNKSDNLQQSVIRRPFRSINNSRIRQGDNTSFIQKVGNQVNLE